MGWWNDLTAGIASDLATLPAAQAAQLVFRLLVAGLIGAALGRDRERLKKAAGLRTYVLVAVGSAALVGVPQHAGTGPDGLSRVLQGLIAGIGFLGAGCIVKATGDEHVHGLTTAAGIWLTAAAGAAAGLGQIPAAVIVGGFGWFTLSVVHRWEHSYQHPGS
jgi:putative Mg2+ transporter-C (MgtC) family protein